MMKKNLALIILSTALIISLISISCSRMMTAGSSDEQNMKYLYTGDQAYPYSQTSKTSQTVVFSGQEISSVINSNLGFTVTGKGISGGTLILEVLIDTLGIKISSMQGNINEDISSMKGKSFMMTMDQNGDNKDLDNAESLSYSIAGLQTANIKSSFANLFPVLPGENIHIGYSWQYTDTVNINTDTENAEMIMSSASTVESKEKISGYDCYKISYSINGTRDGSSQTPQGMIISNVDINGSG
ncbi:MAG: hypothetical protein U5K32_12170 [Bacteroidales bacterium]|nr:hypothetical protein [Bacteroidales bacterium]